MQLGRQSVMISGNGNDARRVLVVDDDSEIRTLLTTVLAMRGLRVDSATNGSEAVELLAQNRYGVVLLDLIMPVGDGYSVLECIRRTPPAEVPVVLVVTGADRSQIERLDASVIHGIVRKPFEPEELAALVLACVEIRDRSAFETMVMAVMAGTPLIALLSRWS